MGWIRRASRADNEMTLWFVFVSFSFRFSVERIILSVAGYASGFYEVQSERRDGTSVKCHLRSI